MFQILWDLIKSSPNSSVFILGSGIVSCVFSHQVMSDSCNLIDCSLPGLSVQGISQARILEWVAISTSRGSSQRTEPSSPASSALQVGLEVLKIPTD